MQYVRSKLVDLYFVVWTILLSPALLAIAVAGTPARRIRRLSRVWVRGLLFGLRTIARLDYRQTGRHNIPAEPCLFVANHQSPWETLAAAVILPDIAIVSKSEVGSIPVVGWAVRASPMIMLDRDGGSAAVRKLLRDCRSALSEGRSILIFPEGTRRSVRADLVFKRGFEILYRELRIPIVPVALNSGVFWGPDRAFKHSGMITVSFLPVIPQGLRPADVSARLLASIAAERDRLVGAVGSEPRLGSGGSG